MKNRHKSINDFLKSASGSFLSRLRSKFTQKNGLVQNSKIHNELSEQILSEERLKNWISKRAEWEIQVLSLIYASGSRGLHLLELESNLEIDRKHLKAFLNEALSELFIWHSRCQNSFIYYGFSDFEDAFLNAFAKDEHEPEPVAWISNDKKVELHLIFALAKIHLGKFSIKKDFSFSRFSKKYIMEVFEPSKTENKTADDEISLIFSFLMSVKWISKNADGVLALQPPVFDFLQKNGFRLFSELIFWWEKERFHGSGNLAKLLKFFEKPISALDAAQLFWPYDTCSRLQKNKSAITWTALPRPLRELWILGILKMQKKKHVMFFSLSEYGEGVFLGKWAEQKIIEPIIASSSNYEWLLSQNNGPWRVFQMSCFAQAKNEEDPLRFSISKESFLNGLRSNLPRDYIKDFLTWNKAVPNVSKAIQDWYRIYNDSSIEALQVLRIKNQEKYAELSACKPFLACVIESIPNFGFIIKPECEKKIREILANFSLEPASAVIEQSEEILSKLMETESFKLPYPVPDTGNAIFD